MAIPVLIIGKSGSGKSTSLRNFSESELYLINVSKKPLPFKKKFESTFETDSYENIHAALIKTQKKAIVIDDAGYLITNQFMKNHGKTGGGNAVFGLYNDIADKFWELLESIKGLEEDKIVYLIMHEDKNEFGDVKPKTIGKLLDEKVCLEGLFTIVLRSSFKDGRYVFETQSNGLTVCKSPMGLLDGDIDNDLKEVDSKIRDFYGIKKIIQEVKRA